MSRTMPLECEHGNVIDWGDFGPDDDTEPPTCPQCEGKPLHRHANPSPSHCIAAWCNGTADDRGCGGPVPLYDFRDCRQDEWPYESYFIDRRDPRHLAKAVEDYLQLPNGPRFAETLRAILSAEVVR